MNARQTDPGGGGAARIREMRLGAGLTQGALAALVGVTAHTVGSWEAGRRKPSQERLAAVAFHCKTARAGEHGPGVHVDLCLENRVWLVGSKCTGIRRCRSVRSGSNNRCGTSY